MAFTPTSSEAKSFPFFDFPPEIRNLIYAWTFLLSRQRSAEYNEPDFIVHGDKRSDDPSSERGGIRWLNVPSFPLL